MPQSPCPLLAPRRPVSQTQAEHRHVTSLLLFSPRPSLRLLLARVVPTSFFVTPVVFQPPDVTRVSHTRHFLSGNGTTGTCEGSPGFWRGGRHVTEPPHTRTRWPWVSRAGGELQAASSSGSSLSPSREDGRGQGNGLPVRPFEPVLVPRGEADSSIRGDGGPAGPGGGPSRPCGGRPQGQGEGGAGPAPQLSACTSGSGCPGRRGRRGVSRELCSPHAGVEQPHALPEEAVQSQVRVMPSGGV